MGSTLRILHVVVNMNRGGAETLLMNLYRSIDRSQVQFDFLTFKEGVFDQEINSLGGKVYRIPYVTETGHIGYLKSLKRFFANHKEYKIIHSHLDKMSGFVLRAAKKAGIPTRIAHSHNTESEGNIAIRTYKSLAGRNIIPYATDLFACSDLASQWLFKSQKGTAKILKNGINPSDFIFSEKKRKTVREELMIDAQSFVWGHIGRLANQKNHAFLIKLFSEYSEMNKHAVLLLAGDGPLREELEKKVKEMNLEHKVRFLGIRSDINQLLQAFDVFVFPSLHEGLPVTLIEAQGSGLPCVISDTITQEVDLGANLVTFRSLHDVSSWLGKISEIDSAPRHRSNTYTRLVDSGYDINKTALELQDYYLACGGDTSETSYNLYSNI